MMPSALIRPAIYVAIGFKDIATSDNGRWARIVFIDDSKNEVPVQLAAVLLGTLLPQLIGVDAECERRREGSNSKRAKQIKQGSVGTTEGGGVVFEFIIPTGQRYLFEMDKIGATLVLESLSIALQSAVDKSDKRDPPRGH